MADNEAIAVIGLAARMPGAMTVDQFWDNLLDGRDCLTDMSYDEVLARGESRQRLDHPAYVRRRPLLPDMEYFDAKYFGMTPREAEIRDPQHRLFLQTCHAALEHGGYDPLRYEGSVGVYGGVNGSRYPDLHLRCNPALVKMVGELAIETSNHSDYVSTFAAYKLGLRGPALTVATACSTSLVAIHLATQALRNGECDMALAGGVEVEWPYGVGYLYTPGGIYSSDGRCRPFDKRAEGTVFGSGVGAVLLKRLPDALADHDTVYAIVRGSAVNNDGSDKVAFAAPSVNGQAACIAEALVSADVHPATISYVEGHGTATTVGDPIEIKALAQAYRFVGGEFDTGYAGIGSVKSNVGHLGPAAGVAGFIKTVLALHREVIPPSIHFEAPNPALELEKTPFEVVDRVREWPRVDGVPRRAGVSSFGIGGTNAHAILEEAPLRPAGPPSQGRPQLIVWSAATAEASTQLGEDLAKHVAWRTPDLADMAYTLQVGRRNLAHRRSASIRTADEAAAALVAAEEAGGLPDPLVFAFPGQGAQRPRMAHGIYARSEAFRTALDGNLEILSDLLGTDLGQLWRESEPSERFHHTTVVQPLLYAIECAFATALTSLGVRPAAVVGHSLGELAAATVAGVFGREDGLRIVASRSRLMGEMPPGTMVAVAAAEPDVAALLSEELSIAAVNGPRQVVVSGADAPIREFLARSAEAGLQSRRLSTSHAFHSQLMAEAAARFREEVAGVALAEPALPFYSCATGRRESEACLEPSFWSDQLVEPVRFADAAAAILGDHQGGTVLEVGPGDTLSLLMRPAARKSGVVTRPLAPGQDNEDDQYAAYLAVVGALWAGGRTVDWTDLSDGARTRIGLPTYPFARVPHFVPHPLADDAVPAPSTAGAAGQAAEAAEAAAASTGETEPRPDGGYQTVEVTWARRPEGAAAPARSATRTALLFLPADPVSARTALSIAQRAGYAGLRVRPPGVSVGPDPSVDTSSRAAVFDLIGGLARRGELPGTVVHAVLLGPQADTGSDVDGGFWSLLWLIQAMQRYRGEAAIQSWRLTVLTRGAVDVSGGEPVAAARAMLLGLLRTLAQEIPTVDVRLIDVDTRTATTVCAGYLDGTDTVVALRGNRPWVPSVRPLAMSPGDMPLRRRGTYVITGGLGALGVATARELAVRGTEPRTVLIGRSAEPPAGSPEERRTAALIGDLEAMGAQVLAIAADVADEPAMRSAFDRVHRTFGPVHGVFHAAGTAGDGLLEVRGREQAERVLRPKVSGALVLDALAGEERDLDFLAYFGSRAALTGLVGSGDYAAANAFLDAMAAAQTGGDRRVVSIQWPGWADGGMAVRGSVTADSDSTVDGVARLTGEEWFLDEHRFDDLPLMPGAGYLDRILAAARSEGLYPDQPLVLSDLAFTAPLLITTATDFRVVFRPLGEVYVASAQARPAGTTRWTEHATAILATTDRERSTIDLGVLHERLDAGERLDPATGGGLVTFGPRWDNVTRAAVVGERIVMELDLPEEFRGDLSGHAAHPALLDRATSTIQFTGDSLHLPFLYREAVFFAPLPARMVADVRLRPARAGSLVADVDLYDTRGRQVAAISGFTMRAVDRAAFTAAASAPAAAPGTAPAAATAPSAGSLLPATLGVSMLFDVVTSSGPAVVAVVPGGRPPVPGHVWSDDRGVVAPADRSPQSATVPGPQPVTVPGSQSVTVPGTPAPKPTLAAVAPTTALPVSSTPNGTGPADIERRLGQLWEEVLGEPDVDPEADFFDVGGNSLAGVQLMARVRDAFGLELGIGVLFEMSTIRALARELARLGAR